ncbi:threonine/serine exporter family protein [Poseidonibacter antarcticus]|uniref:threonine/serine exporter family protein n=1 Tax=Poseidonibacter antarcticus TaxID=2478538 RepID=UPI000EF4E1AB|nr:threonine/serine exporter family protein [Poseidonibacter antarcticus]
MMIIILNILLKSIFASVASTGFAMLFNVPKATLKYCALGGGITYIIRNVSMQMGLSIVLSTFIAAACIGFITLKWSKKFLVPRPVYSVASIIPMIPGTFAFTAMISLVDMNTHGVTPELIEIFIENALKALSILGAITFGLALTSLYYMRLNRPVV